MKYSTDVVTLRLEPMTDEQYLAYRQRAEIRYAHNIAKSDGMPLPEAQKKARQDYEWLLPDGLATNGHHLWIAYDGDVEVGMLWLRMERNPEGLHAYGNDIEVCPDLRRRGYGRAIMQAAEELCRQWNVVSIHLNVLGFKLGARALYEQMGFKVVSIQMQKRL